MSIVSHPANQNYRDNYDAVFGAESKRPNECRIYNTTCPTPELCNLADPNAPCLAGALSNEEVGAGMTVEELKVELEREE